MREMIGNRSYKKYIWLLLLLLAVVSLYFIWKPLVLSVDSSFGFLAYKGTVSTHSFNVIQDIPGSDINRVNLVFISWWSPGQWLYPGILNYIFGTRLGVGAILITLISLVAGFWGYYQVFILYKFSRTISALSLLIIFSSSTLYYCFIVYQGGEVLEFAFFPWFLLYVGRIRRISIWNLIAVSILFLFCFVAKTTLLLYCTLVLIARIFHLFGRSRGGQFQMSPKSFLLILPALVLLFSVYILYLSRGPRPTLFNHFEIPAEGVFVSLLSPLCSILSIQEWLDRISRFFSESFQRSVPVYLISSVFYLLLLVLFLRLLRWLILSKEITVSYKSLFIILYAGLSVFFLFCYSFNAIIDFNSRHFKLLGYLFVPGLLSILCEKFKFIWIQLAVILFLLLALTDIIYLKEKWTKGRYISANYFYRNYQPSAKQDKLDETSYREILNIDRQLSAGKENAVFFIESTTDVAIDLHHLSILQRSEDDIRSKIYHKKTPVLIVCISKKTLFQEPDILLYKFPDYRNFEKIRENDNFLFLLGK